MDILSLSVSVFLQKASKTHARIGIHTCNKSFMDEYNASKAAYEAYQEVYAKWKNPPKPSARKKLEE